jgi:hypothetical protein
MGAALVFATAYRQHLVHFHTIRDALRTAETPPIMKSTVDKTSENVLKTARRDHSLAKSLGVLTLLTSDIVF